MDGTGNEKEEEAEMPDPQSCSSSNRASMDGTDDEKEEETGVFDGPLFSQLQDVLLSRLRDGTPAYPRSCWFACSTLVRLHICAHVTHGAG